MRLLSLIFLAFLMGACEEGPSQEDGLAVDSAQSPDVGDETVQFNRIYLKSATDADFNPYIIEHEGSEHLVICHVPPGNPLNFKTKMIGSKAIEAHLNHGSKASHKNSGHGSLEESEIYIGHDYLGACGAPEVHDDIIILDDPIFETDGIVCEGLRSAELYDCLMEHDQNITVEL